MNSIKNKLDNSLLMVIAPASDNAENLNFENLISYLQSNTAFEFKIKHCKDYNEAITMLQSGSAQIGWLGGGSANQELQAQNSLVEEFAVGVPKGKSVPFYRSQFIVRSSSEIQILEDVRNKNIALGDVYSTSGYEIPKKEL
jgi:phosphonate transport system substrate-binding protein